MKTLLLLIQNHFVQAPINGFLLFFHGYSILHIGSPDILYHSFHWLHENGVIFLGEFFLGAVCALTLPGSLNLISRRLKYVLFILLTFKVLTKFLGVTAVFLILFGLVMADIVSAIACVMHATELVLEIRRKIRKEHARKHKDKQK